MYWRAALSAVFAVAFGVQVAWYYVLEDLKGCARRAYKKKLVDEPLVRVDYGYGMMLRAYEVVWKPKATTTDSGYRRGMMIKEGKKAARGGAGAAGARGAAGAAGAALQKRHNLVFLASHDAKALHEDVQKGHAKHLLFNKTAMRVMSSSWDNSTLVVSVETALGSSNVFGVELSAPPTGGEAPTHGDHLAIATIWSIPAPDDAGG